MPLRKRGSVYEKDQWEIDLDQRQLRNNKVVVPLGGRAFEIIQVLVEAAGELVSKTDLMARVWPSAIVEDNTLQVHIAAVRRALGSDRALLQTTSGRGYRLLGDWQRQAGGEAPAGTDRVPSPKPIIRANLPQRSSELIGRDSAMRQLPALLSAYRLVTLTGPGGIGKTKLAQEVARELCPAFRDDVQLVELAGIADPDLVPPAIASVLGLQLPGNDLSPQSLARAIGGRTVLIVLDNCEHLIEAAARAVEAILHQCSRATILATSREVMRIEGEFAYRVASLDVPPADLPAMETALEHSAIRLFAARMRAGHAGFELNPQNLGSVAAICRRLDGIPLAIELAAARAATLGIDEVVSRLDDRFAFLTVGRRTALPRHRTLRAMLDWSYDLLSPAERTVLRHLAVFVGGFTLDAARAVAVTPATDADAVLDGIVTLTAKSLVSVDAATPSPRYALLETIRAYSYEKLIASVDPEPVRRRHARYFQSLFRQAEAERGTRPISDWLATYGREIDNVRAAIDWAFTTGDSPSIAVELSADSTAAMFDLSLVNEGRRRGQQALAAIQSGVTVSPRREMQLLAVLQASRIYTDGPSEAGFAAWERVLGIAIEVGDVDFQARALWGLWNDNLYAGRPARARSFAGRFLDLTAAQGHAAITVTGGILGRRLIGTALHYAGDQAAARPHLDHVLSHYVRADHRWIVLGSRLDQATVTRATLVRVLWLQGYPDQARSLSDEAMRSAIADDHLMSILYVLVEAAIPLAVFAGDLASARRLLGMLLEQAPRAGFRIWFVLGRCFNAVLLGLGEDRAAGLPGLVEAVRDLEETGFRAHLTMFLGFLAQSQADAGLIDDAGRTIGRALEWCDTNGEHWFSAELLRIKADMLPDGAADASDLLGQALDLSRRQGARSWELRATMSLARRLWRQGRGGEARALLAPVCDGFTEGFETVDLREAAGLLRVLPTG